ncbi:hypothetical protein G4B88_023102 [Cannabis sativa]|uniref:cytokinin riboside 5'-monophosphate phosphoribohydrolase n=1 Tax=Cannabis sativa TaxID=3483 RepID=A0A7J6EK54_CANSA|nr:hypothetical protein G4B88_023102 [Cannabis sativa]
MEGRYLIRLEFKIYTSIIDEHLYDLSQTPKSVRARYFGAFGNIIVLIGGYEIIEELLEMITWVRLGIHKKLMRYYNSLLALFDNGVQEGFIKSGAQEIIFSAPTTKKFIIKMEPYAPSHEPIASLESSQMEQLGEYPNQDKSSMM